MTTEGGNVILIVKCLIVLPKTQKHDISNLQKQCSALRRTPITARLILMSCKNVVCVLDQHSSCRRRMNTDVPLKVNSSSHWCSEHTCVWIVGTSNVCQDMFEDQSSVCARRSNSLRA